MKVDNHRKIRQDLEARSDRQNLGLACLWVLDLNSESSGTKIALHPPQMSTLARKVTSKGSVLVRWKYDTGAPRLEQTLSLPRTFSLLIGLRFCTKQNRTQQDHPHLIQSLPSGPGLQAYRQRPGAPPSPPSRRHQPHQSHAWSP